MAALPVRQADAAATRVSFVIAGGVILWAWLIREVCKSDGFFDGKSR